MSHAIFYLVLIEWMLSLPLSLLAIWNSGDSAGHSAESERMAWAYYSLIYGSAAARVVDVAVGLIVYVLSASPVVSAWLCARPRGCSITAALALAGSILQSSSGIAALQSEAYPDLSAVARYAGLIGTLGMGAVFATAWLMLYVIVRPDDASKRAAAMFNLPMWDCVASRSYSVYLLHYPLLLILFRCFPVTAMLGQLHNFRTFFVVYLMVVVLSLAAASVQDALVAKCVERLRAGRADVRLGKRVPIISCTQATYVHAYAVRDAPAAVHSIKPGASI